MRALTFLFHFAVCLLLFFHYQTCTTQICAPTLPPTPIEDIEANSSHHDQQCVKVSGKVTDKISITLLNLYHLRDETGHTLTVTVPFNMTMPSIGDEVEVCGQIAEIFNISDVWNPWVLIETQRSVTKEFNARTKGNPTETREGGTPILPY